VRFLIKLISTGFYAGYMPFAPGTTGSLLGVLIYILLYKYPFAFVLVTLILFTAGFMSCAKAEWVFNEKDSKKIVIDEIASMCLVFIFIKPDWLMLAAGFLLFRFFDIVKPFPAKTVEKLSGSKAVMLDDMVAAVYTVVLLFALSRLQAAGIRPVLNIQALSV
jgi:phosphatidylglycerophosphatase A